MTQGVQVGLAFAFGFAFIVALLLLAIEFPEPTPFQHNVFRVVLALAAGGVGAMIPGFMAVSLSPSAGALLRAGGALAVFAIAYFWNPAQLASPSSGTDETGSEWPDVRSGESLRRKLGRLSRENKEIIRVVASADDYIYIMDLANCADIPRSELAYRAVALESDQLMEIVHFTDIAYRLHPALVEALGQNARERVIDLVRQSRPSPNPQPDVLDAITPRMNDAKLDMRVLELHNIRVYDLDTMGSQEVENMVLVVGDEGGIVLDRLDGHPVDADADDYGVAAELFKGDGKFAVVTGVGTNADGSGTLPGVSSIAANGKDYTIVFSLQGLCIATVG